MTTTVSNLDRSLQQRRAALRVANEIRTRRAQLKRDLKAGSASLADIVAEPPEWLETAKVYDFLLHVPKFGRVKANRVINRCRISPSKTFGGLSDRQRNELLAAGQTHGPAASRRREQLAA